MKTLQKKTTKQKRNGLKQFKRIELGKEFLTLYRINKFLRSIDDLGRLLRLIMVEANQAVGAEASSIALYDQNRKQLYFTITLGRKSKQLKKMRIKLGQGIIGWVAKKRCPLNVAKAAKDQRFNAKIDKKTGFQSKSILAVPIIHKTKLIGALEVINKVRPKGAKCFSQQDIRLLEIVAGQAGIAIENAKLYQQLADKHQDLKSEHKQLIATQEKLIAMERLSAMGNMASRIVHDLRTPLTIIRAYAETLAEQQIELKERTKSSQIIMDEVDRLVGMTQELLQFARGESNLLFSDYLLGDFIGQVSSYLRRDFQKNNIQLVTQLNYAGKIYIDRYKLQRAFFNISANAKEAMPEGGTFKIKTTLVGQAVEIKLSDTGCGIPKEIKGKLFEPFISSGKSHGTGLGLAITKRIIESHNGSISVQSTQADKGSGVSGTTFIIKLPLKK